MLDHSDLIHRKPSVAVGEKHDPPALGQLRGFLHETPSASATKPTKTCDKPQTGGHPGTEWAVMALRVVRIVTRR